MQKDRPHFRTAAIQTWRIAPAKSGNEAFFQLGIDLRSAGLSTDEIEDVLRLETGNARHPAGRASPRDQAHHQEAAGIVAADGCLTVGETSVRFVGACRSMCATDCKGRLSVIGPSTEKTPRSSSMTIRENGCVGELAGPAGLSWRMHRSIGVRGDKEGWCFV